MYQSYSWQEKNGLIVSVSWLSPTLQSSSSSSSSKSDDVAQVVQVSLTCQCYFFSDDRHDCVDVAMLRPEGPHVEYERLNDFRRRERVTLTSRVSWYLGTCFVFTTNWLNERVTAHTTGTNNLWHWANIPWHWATVARRSRGGQHVPRANIRRVQLY